MPSPAKKPASTTTSKSAAKPVEARSGTPAKPAAAKPAANPGKPATTLSPAERMKMIAEAAYYLAQKRGFIGGNELSDWVAAEKQVDSLLTKRG